MTDDQKPPAEPMSSEPTDQPEANQSGQPASSSLRIKIGSQREPAGEDVEADSPADPGAEKLTQLASAAPEASESGEPVPAEGDAPAAEESTEDAEGQTAEPSPPAVDSNRAARSARARRLSGELVDEINDALGGMSLDQLMNESTQASGSNVQEIELDQRCQATVIKIDRESAFFSLGVHNEGIAALKHFGEQVPEIGAQMEVVPTRFLRDENLYELLVPGASIDVQDWSDLSEGVVVEAKITGHNKGGLECEVNRIRGFIPISQISLYRVEDLEPYVGQALQCVVAEVNPERRNLVLSHRAVLEREKQEAREKLLAELQVGQIREGVVRRIQDFGAFVDIGGVDGLVHISQLSWDRIGHPSEVVEEGQTIQVRIEKIDPATGKIGLSYRELLDHPWQDADAKYAVGAEVDGTVSKIMQFGAFVRIAPGVEGLVHISELAHHRVQRVSSVVQEGQEVKVKVLSVDPEAQRMSLSIKAVGGAAPSETAEAVDESEESSAAEAAPAKRRPDESLKGGLGRDAGGEQFGLKW